MARRYQGYPSLALDGEDLEQEASIVALRCLREFDPDRVTSDRRAFLRRAIRNHFVKTRDRAYASKRMPQDAQGHARLPVSLDQLNDDLPGWFRKLEIPRAHDVEQRVQAQQLVGQLYRQLPREDWDLLVEAFVVGAHEARAVRGGKTRAKARLRLDVARQRAAVILLQICYPVQRETEGMSDFITSLYAGVEPGEVPTCLPGQADPQGYDHTDELCQGCPDKFRCLPMALEAGLVQGDLSLDREVEAVVGAQTLEAKARAHERAVERMLRRQAIIAKANLVGEKPVIPADLLTRRPKVVAGPVEVVADPEMPSGCVELRSGEHTVAIENIGCEACGGECRGHDEPPLAGPSAAAAGRKDAKEPKAKPKKKATKKRSAKHGRKVAKERKAKAVSERKVEAAREANGRGTMRNGKLLPPIRQLTKFQMDQAIRRIRIGQPFDLQLGMQIVRKKREGEIVITLVDNGFECDGVIYSSLSTAAMYQERRIVSANAFFNLEQNKCTEIRNKRGKPIAGQGVRYKP
jgi:DNA-directed RNA polymerase specialized sigma24 family protein